MGWYTKIRTAMLLQVGGLANKSNWSISYFFCWFSAGGHCSLDYIIWQQQKNWLDSIVKKRDIPVDNLVIHFPFVLSHWPFYKCVKSSSKFVLNFFFSLIGERFRLWQCSFSTVLGSPLNQVLNTIIKFCPPPIR